MRRLPDRSSTSSSVLEFSSFFRKGRRNCRSQRSFRGGGGGGGGMGGNVVRDEGLEVAEVFECHPLGVGCPPAGPRPRPGPVSLVVGKNTLSPPPPPSTPGLIFIALARGCSTSSLFHTHRLSRPPRPSSPCSLPLSPPCWSSGSPGSPPPRPPGRPPVPPSPPSFPHLPSWFSRVWGCFPGAFPRLPWGCRIFGGEMGACLTIICYGPMTRRARVSRFTGGPALK